MPVAPKPTSLSPLLGVRVMSSTDAIDPPKPSRSLAKLDEATVEMEQGLPHLTVPLPSRNEPCIFVLKPVTHTIGDLVAMLKLEDPGIDRVIVRSIEGIRIASNTSMQTLLRSDFDLVINETTHRIRPPPMESSTGLSGLSQEELQRMGDVRALIGQLYEALHVEEYQAAEEQRLVRELETLQDELAPLENERQVLAEQSERRTNNLTWMGLGLMSVQFGILARLTWWEYSWDIMEPVTYFVTYGTAMACYAYFVLTRQDYLLPDVRDRQFLLTFHKRAKKHEWDVGKYNALRDGIVKVEQELRKVRDPSKLRPSNEALRRAAQDLETGILGSQVHIGNIKDMLKGKFSSS